MKEICLLDADIIGFRVGFTTENDEPHIAEWRTDELIQRIVHETNSVSYKCFLSGADNFRYAIYPEYKANRIGKARPKHLEHIRAHIIKHHNGMLCNGHEADDELGIEQTALGEASVIASIDKDLLMVPGHHYDFVKGIHRYVNELDALRTFYAQLIAGDGADNIPSFDGKIRNQIPQFIVRLQLPIYEMTNEVEMWEYVKQVYEDADMEGELKSWEWDHSKTIRNAQCLYILRKEGGIWQVPSGQTPE